ncbi:MAG TPA: type II toxin-antitoxin system prevent-host-death family antitoxin, partial [Candidatus Limnocylindria bacterium]|nr:type II toxin-antitoxin system prevent-host-death family antitoxin [Candidatus Limnocylindria bacterium]
MITIDVTTFKNRLGHYLRLVRRGNEIVITSHTQHVARILPYAMSIGEIIEATRPVSDLMKVKG